jgi:hypothetical protein
MDQKFFRTGMISKIFYLQGGSSPAQHQLFTFVSATLKVPFSPVTEIYALELHFR